MAFYVEVMCNERKQGHAPGDILTHRCWSDRNDNPQGRTMTQAADEAKRQGWEVRGKYACCPGCKEPTNV